MKISIALATYNGSRFLAEQLDSLLRQTRLPDELIISDDQSTDDTVDIINRFSKKAPFPVFLSQNSRNVGYTKNFELAIKRTTGDLIFLSDQDDYWLPNKLEVIEKISATSPNATLIVHDMEIATTDLTPTGFTKMQQSRRRGINARGGSISGCCTAIRLEVLPLILPIPACFSSHDVWIHKMCSLWDGRLVTPEVLQLYRRHNSNSSEGLTSRATKLNRYASWLRYTSGNTSEICFQRLEQIQAIKSRLVQASDFPNSNQVEIIDINKALKNIDNEYNAVNTRLRILQKSRPFRFLSGIRLLGAGGYHYFKGGFMSLIKDLLRS